jgi:homoserine O-acetyltransferase
VLNIRSEPLANAVKAWDFAVPLPPRLARFGPSVRAMLTGGGNEPAVVVIGGISATRFAAGQADGGAGWWPGMVGAGCAVDPARRAVLAFDFAADETGAAAPTTRDQAEVAIAVMNAAGIDRAAIVAASYGGMVALSLAAAFPGRVERLAVISADARPHPTATAMRELQRRTVALGMARGCGAEALAIARGWAMLSYRTPEEFGERFAGGLPTDDPRGTSAPGAYLRACGDSFARRMSPGRFLSLSGSIDRHDVDPAAVRAPALLIGAACDQLIPPSGMRDLADRLGGPARLHMRVSRWGHDMFLKEASEIGALVGPFLDAPLGENVA